MPHAGKVECRPPPAVVEMEVPRRIQRCWLQCRQSRHSDFDHLSELVHGPSRQHARTPRATGRLRCGVSRRRRHLSIDRGCRGAGRQAGHRAAEPQYRDSVCRPPNRCDGAFARLFGIDGQSAAFVSSVFPASLLFSFEMRRPSLAFPAGQTGVVGCERILRATSTFNFIDSCCKRMFGRGVGGIAVVSLVLCRTPGPFSRMLPSARRAPPRRDRSWGTRQSHHDRKVLAPEVAAIDQFQDGDTSVGWC